MLLVGMWPIIRLLMVSTVPAFNKKTGLPHTAAGVGHVCAMLQTGILCAGLPCPANTMLPFTTPCCCHCCTHVFTMMKALQVVVSKVLALWRVLLVIVHALQGSSNICIVHAKGSAVNSRWDLTPVNRVCSWLSAVKSNHTHAYLLEVH